MSENRPAYILPTLSLGGVLALVIALLTGILWGLGQLPRETALVVLAICAMRL